MIIEETKIPNILPDNINKSKVILAESIINNIYPLFNEVYTGNIEEVKNLTKKLDEKKKKVVNEKNDLGILLGDYKKKKKVAKLLDRIEKMVSSGLVHDGTLKHEITVLLKIATKLSDEKLDYHLQDTLRTISKRFSS